MKIELNYQNAVICLPGAAVQKAETATEQDLRVLLYIAGNPAALENFDAAKAAVELDIPEREVENAISFWRGAGILKTGRSKKKTETEERQTDKPPVAPVTMQTGVPGYTGKQLEEIMKERARLGRLLEECQKVLDRVFNVSESNLVVAMCDNMHLDDDYILLLCSYCMQKKESGVTVKYVYNTAYALYEQNIVTFAALEEYIAGEEASRDFTNYLRKLFGFGSRALSAKEKKFFDSWQKLGLPREVIRFAYEKSVDSTVELSLPHLNKILVEWKKDGVKTLADAKKADQKFKEQNAGIYPERKKKEETPEFKSFDVDSFFDAAKKKSGQTLDKKEDK